MTSPSAPQLRSEGGRCPLRKVDLQATVRELLYSASVRQTFVNDSPRRVEAVYIFPLPARAAVHGFTIRAGDRIVESSLTERGKARKDYAQSLLLGTRTALLEEERCDIFTLTLGNIGPGETVVVSLELDGEMECTGALARLSFPLALGRVEVPGTARLDRPPVGVGTEPDTDLVPDASRLTPPRDGAPVELSARFRIEPSELALEGVASTCHFARVEADEQGGYDVELVPGEFVSDRPLGLEITFEEGVLQTALRVDESTGAFALTVIPPESRGERRGGGRDLVILIDHSESLRGWPEVAARRLARDLVESLSEGDRFNIVAAGRRCSFLDGTGLQRASQTNKGRAAAFLAQPVPRGGSRPLGQIVALACDHFETTGGRERHLVLLSSGQIADDSALLRAERRGTRISTIALGESAREGLLRRLSDLSGGRSFAVRSLSQLDQSRETLQGVWGEPSMKALSLTGAREQSPRCWDVWPGVPSTFFGVLEGGERETVLRGWMRDGKVVSLPMKRCWESKAGHLYRGWARSRILEMEEEFMLGRLAPSDLIAFSLEAGVLCRFTGFFSEDEQGRPATVGTEQPLQTTVQPVPLPERTGGGAGGVRSQSRPQGRSGRGVGNSGFGPPPADPALEPAPPLQKGSEESVRIALRRVRRRLEADGWERGSRTACLARVRDLVHLVTEYLQGQDYPAHWSPRLRTLLDALLQYQGALVRDDLAAAGKARERVLTLCRASR